MSDDSARRIERELRSWLDTAPPGARVPSTRALVARFGASPVTVQRALRTLAMSGRVETRPGVGTFVRRPRPTGAADHSWQTAALRPPTVRLSALSAAQRVPAPDAIALHSGYPDRSLLPERLVRQALVRASRTDAALTRVPAGGVPALQSWFAAELAAAGASHPPTAREVTVVSGSQSGLSAILRSLVGAGRPLVVESPTYWGAIVAAAQAGVTLVPVPSGADGPDPDDVARALDESGARAFYAQPTYANPTGGQWSAARGAAVLDVVRRRGAFLIEDDWAHDLAIDGAPHPIVLQDADGHVVYLRSLTKSVSPALRVAAVIARGPARERILADRAASSMYVSGVLQTAAVDVVTQPGWRTHLAALRPQLRTRRDLLADALAAHIPAATLERMPVGGLNLWLRLPDGSDVDRIVRAAELRGVIVADGGEWFPAEPSGPYLRLNYSGPDPERFPEAAAILGEVVAAG